MPFFLDTQEAAQRFGGEIAEFGALLDVNRIRHGSPNDLFEFARLLEHSQQLRSDLSALVQSVVRRAHEEILLTDMMGILAAAVGGSSIAETRVDITRPTNVLMEFLLGTGCWRNFGSPARASQSERPSLKPSARGEASGELPISPAASAEEKIEDRASLLDISNELRLTLSRLESSAMQVKLHLDSIEQKIAKAEPPQAPPRWEAPALEPLRPVAAEPERLRQAARAPEPLPRHAAASAPLIEKVVRSPAEEPSEPELPTRGRAIFSHFLPEEEVQAEEENFSSPTFAYAAEGGRNMIPVGVFLALAVVLIAAFCFAYSSYGRGVLSSGIARLKNGHAWLGG
ncbi:MAG TPA: hypothetical protein VL346_04685, partial [Acidobacteriaceae bacterium]|nr:hypothetical protein [Acidobacteriaceae bacterium]